MMDHKTNKFLSSIEIRAMLELCVYWYFSPLIDWIKIELLYDVSVNLFSFIILI